MSDAQKSQRRLILTLTSVLVCASFAAGQAVAAETFECFWCPCQPVLDPQTVGKEFIAVAENPPSVRRARGERQGLVFAVRATADLPQGIDVEVVPAEGIDARVGIVTFVERRAPYAAVVASRSGSRARSWPLADAIVPDENERIALAKTWQGDTRFARICGTAAKTAPLREGDVRYVWLDIAVPAATRPGTRRLGVRFSAAATRRTVPVTVEVLPFVLPMHEKLVSISNEFTDDATLRWLADVGATSMRTNRLTGTEESTERIKAIRDMGFRMISQGQPPATAAEVAAIPRGVHVFFYGVDEPQPKPSRNPGWSRMAEHVKKSGAIHSLGGKVGTSLPFELAEELAEKDSRVYRELAKLGVTGVFEALDWTNYGLGVQRIGTPRARGNALFGYIAKLQEDRRAGRVRSDGRPVSKRNRIETFYGPMGMMRDPFFGRLLFGFYLHQSGLDGAMAWTLWRPRGNPFDDADGPDATLGYPAAGGWISTYTAEALRNGINDLRYAWLTADAGQDVSAVLAKFDSLERGGRRIDFVLPPSAMHDARVEMIDRLSK